MNLDLRLYQEAEHDVTELHDRFLSELAAGKAVDWNDYKYRLGRIKGLQDALAILEEAQRRVLGIERKS